MSKDIQYHAFTTEFIGTSRQLNNQVHIQSGADIVLANALWDTGASFTCISTDVASQLHLVSVGRKQVFTPAGSKIFNTYLVDIILPNKVCIPNVQVSDSDIGQQGIGVLIGMDIISKGDLAVSHYHGNTVFTFRVPSKCRTDYVKEINIENIVGKHHGSGKRKKKK